MSNQHLDRFVADVASALSHALQLDACHVVLGDSSPTASGDDDAECDRLIFPLQIDDRAVGYVDARRGAGLLTEREQTVMWAELGAVAERIDLMQRGLWPDSSVTETVDPIERARAERDQFESLLHAQHLIARQEDLHATLEAIVDEIERLLNLSTAHIYTVDRDAGTLMSRVTRISGSRARETLREMPIGTGITSIVLESGQAERISNAHLDSRSIYPSDAEPLVRLLGEHVMVAPLHSGDSVAGVIFVNRLGHRDFSDHEFRLFQLFAGHIETAFDKAVRLDIETQSRRAAELISDLGSRLTGVTTEEDLAIAVAQTALALSSARYVCACVPGRLGDSMLEVSNIENGQLRVSHIEREPLALDIDRVTSIECYQELPQCLASIIDVDDFRNAILVPIIGSAGQLGRIWIASRGERVRPTIATNYLESLANSAAETLERLRASELASELEATIDVLSHSSRIALEAQYEEQAAAQLVSLLNELLHVRVASAWLSEPHKGAEDATAFSFAAYCGPPNIETSYIRNSQLTVELDRYARDWDDGVLVIPVVHRSELSPEVRQACASLGIGAIVAFRLADADQRYGIVVTDYDSAGALPSEDTLRLARGVIDQFSLGLGAIRVRERRMDLYRSSVEALAATVDAKDPYTHTHSRNVAFYSRLLAERMGLPKHELLQIELAGLLHDIGKIGIADRILTKTGPLSAQERMVVVAHPVRGAEILAGDEGLSALVPIVRHHHERHDGLGYPDGLGAGEIPIGASIVGVADAVDTMLNDRSYAHRRTLQEVRAELAAAAGTQFHPDVARLLIQLIDESPELMRIQDDPESRRTGSSIPSDHLPIAEVAQVRVISRLAQELGALTDLETFVRGACSIVEDELGYERVEISLAPVRPHSLSVGGNRALAEMRVSNAISNAVVEQGQVVNVPDLSALAEFATANAAIKQTGSALAVPLRVDEELIGSLCVLSERNGAFSIIDEALLTVAANQLAAALRVAQLHDQVKWTARHDGLTQALNHGAFYEELTHAIDQYSLTGEPVSLILCDVEGLKGVNDQFGHLAGDRVLRLLVRRIREIVNDRDVIARYGGDEFAIITFGTTDAEAANLAQRLHRSLEQSPLLGSYSITKVTTGIAQVGVDSMAPAELVKIADHRLYHTRGQR